ncbi:MAG TPA: hypothetical protein VF533_16565 [Solirubrobacteraceae bacterium]|jgi:hypothetical protein
MAPVDRVKQALLGHVNHLLERPGMMAVTGREAEVLLFVLLGLLETADDREIDGLEGLRLRHGRRGYTGPFAALFGDRTTYRAEVVSIAAQACAMGGYFVPEATVAAEDWTSVVERFGGPLEDTDVRRSVLGADHGPPSFTVRDSEGRWDAVVDGFMRDGDPSSWVFFDYWEENDRGRYRPIGAPSAPWVHPEDGWLRDVRLPSERWEDGLVLTAFGKFLRWGHGWTLYHAKEDRFPEGVADQLRGFDDADPSRSLGRAAEPASTPCTSPGSGSTPCASPIWGERSRRSSTAGCSTRSTATSAASTRRAWRP